MAPEARPPSLSLSLASSPAVSPELCHPRHAGAPVLPNGALSSLLYQGFALTIPSAPPPAQLVVLV